MRLNKFLAHCGIASRRQSEKIIADGEININNKVCTDPAKKIEPNDTITYKKRKLFIKKKLSLFCRQQT